MIISRTTVTGLILKYPLDLKDSLIIFMKPKHKVSAVSFLCSSKFVKLTLRWLII
jgi:hypothetical protein